MRNQRSMKLTQLQGDTLRLLMRSPDSGDGWRTCAPIMFKTFILPMPESLIEKDIENRRARLTHEGRTVVEWL